MGGQTVKFFLLIFLPVLLQNVGAEVKMLDMAPNAVDDIFSGCRDKMLHTVTAPGGLLQKEIKAKNDFAGMWRGPGGTCEKQIYGGTAHHLAALQAYGNSENGFRKIFNRMVQTNGSNATAYQQFPFKSLHFLLTDAMRLLNNGTTCQHVYYGTSTQFTAETGKEIRFGRFLHPKIQESEEIEAAESESEGTLFNITSCSVVNIEYYTCTSENIEHLISPNEVFTVQSLKVVSNSDTKYTVITLKHSRFQSNHDCYLFPSLSGSSGSSASLLTPKALVLMISVVLTIHLSTLGFIEF